MWLFIAILFSIQVPTSSEDAETFMNVSQIIRHRGYPSEEYEVLTPDGYYVSLNRIPHGREKPRNRGPKPVVFLQHGIFGEGRHWVENLANNSLGFILADSGYDVWLGNSRGTSWSQRHQHLSADQAEFWDFSFHEMAMYDLPAMVDFVLQKTGQKQLHYVGHSQGCTIAFIAFSAMPELAQKIKMFFALAPVVTARYARNPVMKIPFLLDKNFKTISDKTGLFVGGLVEFLDKTPGKEQLCCIDFNDSEKQTQHLQELLLGRMDASLQLRKLWRFVPQLCLHTLLHKPCAKILFLLGGYNEKNLNVTRLEVYTTHFPDKTSVKNIIHWAQVVRSGEFKAFDYGSKNAAVYYQDTPPFYQVEEMPVPTAVWSGGEDWVADWRDIRQLLPCIAHLVTYIHIPSWNHWDFIWGLDAPGHLYTSILQLMEGSR